MGGSEAQIVGTHQVLVVLDDRGGIDGFGGAVVTPADLAAPPDFTGKTVYLCGDLARARALDLRRAARVFVVGERCTSVDRDLPFEALGWQVVDVGRIPVQVHGVGVWIRRWLDPSAEVFHQVRAEHVFQHLTESTKPGQAHRTGLYLTPVERRGQELWFHLLRCSTNLSGPTENFRATDRRLVGALNVEASALFAGAAPLNHVLAQIYHNTPATGDHRQTKAKIQSHADKTKDMPRNGIMAFCTFYDRLDGLAPLADDPYDWGVDGVSALTRLMFRLKPQVAERPGCTLPARFTVPLYPGSVFFLPLSTNRAYTHEIRPSPLDAAELPTRLGYVVRCSSRRAVHADGHTHLVGQGGRTPLEPPTPEGMDGLRALYAEENRTDAAIDYGDRFPFSMNEGDALAPSYDPADEFPSYALPRWEEDPFEALSAAVRFEAVGRGRHGAVLVRPDEVRGTPLVRTTTRYTSPAQRFAPAHEELARRICAAAGLPPGFDNALIERYTPEYATMGAHSDQAQDLEPGSSIAVYSCYADPERAAGRRVLVVESKEPGGGTFEVPLLHHHVVVFSVDTNRRFRHKIVLDRSADPGGEWLGVTLRRSKTFVRHRGGAALLEDGTPLQLADEAQARQVLDLRRRENRELGFEYPALAVTLSPSDLVPPGSG
ncbi:MAG: hypothetical protein ABMA64_21430 [Myxococcota bacterium]